MAHFFDLVNPSPVQEIISSANNFHFYIKRDDLLHPVIEGNKFRKLKFNFKRFISEKYECILTYGGAFSNHLVAVSQLGALVNIPTIGRLNNNHADKGNPSLSICRQNGMIVLYRDEPIPKELAHIKIMDVPTGGCNAEGIMGCGDIAVELMVQVPEATHIVLPSGTGATALGIAQKNKDITIIVANALKMNWKQHIRSYFKCEVPENVIVWDDIHLGKYGAINNKLVQFMHDFYNRNQIIIDPIYNGKALYAIEQKLNQGYFPPDSRIVYIHTGGSQGTLGINDRYKLHLPGYTSAHYIVPKTIPS